MTTLAAFAALACVAVQEPTVVPGRLLEDVWIVQGTISGRRAVIMIDSGANRTGILPDALLPEGDRGVDIQIGKVSVSVQSYVGSINLLKWLAAETAEPGRPDKPLVAIVGMDFLDKVAIGFDYDKSQVFLWPKGKLAEDAVQGWVGKASRKQDLSQQFGGRYGLPISLGISSGWAVLDTGAANSSFLPAFGKAPDSVPTYKAVGVTAFKNEEGQMMLIQQAKVGDFDIPWYQYNIGSPGSDIPGKPNGLFALMDFRSPRVLIDFPGKAVHFVPPDKNASLSRAITQMTTLPMYFENDQIKLGPFTSKHPDGMRPFQGSLIVSIAGKSMKEVAGAFLGTRPDSLSFMKELAIRVRSDHVIKFAADGRTMDIRMHASGN